MFLSNFDRAVLHGECGGGDETDRDRRYPIGAGDFIGNAVKDIRSCGFDEKRITFNQPDVATTHLVLFKSGDINKATLIKTTFDLQIIALVGSPVVIPAFVDTTLRFVTTLVR